MSKKPPKTAIALTELRRIGLLLESDAAAISVCSLVAGKPIRGSWWGHPQGRNIWVVTEELADHPDVIVTKLVAGKTTFVHRKLWPALLAVARSGETWQTRDLSSMARGLLQKVEAKGLMSLEQTQTSHHPDPKKLGKAVRELESRLLVLSGQFHTENGSHAKRIESWSRWARRVKIGRARIGIEAAKARIERAGEELGLVASSGGPLPWNGVKKNKGRIK